jgi:dTDP-4-dehydrorhamnose 3,5-epimerase
MSDKIELGKEPFIIDGGLAVDERGIVRFVNDFDFVKCGIRRMYSLENHEVGYVRAWHGHEREAKFTTVTKGIAMIGIAPLELFYKKEILEEDFRVDSDGYLVENWKYRRNPESPRTDARHFILSSLRPQILYIPPGYANGFKALVPDTQIIHFSTVTIEEAGKDDLRWPWDAFGEEFWEVEGR